MQHKSNLALACLLAPFVFSFAFGLDIYIPVVPQMQQIFHTSQFLIQLTLSLFLLGIGLGDIFLGPISDHVGRLKVIYAATALFIIGAIGSALAPNITVLIISRVICAVGSCGMLVVAFAIVRDLHSGENSAQLYSWLNAAIGISPTFAPIIGGYLAVYLGWRAVFWFLVLIGISVIILTVFFIRETLPIQQRRVFNHQVFIRYGLIVRNKIFLSHMLFAASGVTVCFSFFSVSSVIIIHLLGIKEQLFGYYFAVFGLVLAFGGVVAGKVVYEFGIARCVQVGLCLMLAGGSLMLVGHWIFGLHLWVFLGTMAIACLGAVFCIGSGAAGAMEPFPEFAGTAAAALQAGQFIISSIIGTILMHFPIHSSVSYAICIISVSVAGFIVSAVSRFKCEKTQ